MRLFHTEPKIRTEQTHQVCLHFAQRCVYISPDASVRCGVQFGIGWAILDSCVKETHIYGKETCM